VKEFRYLIERDEDSEPQYCVEVSGQLHSPGIQLRVKNRQYTLNRRLGRPQGQFGK
jgi:hypothetical protein